MQNHPMAFSVLSVFTVGLFMYCAYSHPKILHSLVSNFAFPVFFQLPYISCISVYLIFFLVSFFSWFKCHLSRKFVFTLLSHNHSPSVLIPPYIFIRVPYSLIQCQSDSNDDSKPKHNLVFHFSPLIILANT